MNTKIFYFSATGNSLAFAKKLAGRLDSTCFVSIPTVIGEKQVPGEAKIGFIFPVYGWGMPRIVEDFINDLQIKRGTYVFAVATCSGTPGGTMIQLKQMLAKKGIVLAAGFVIKEQTFNPLPTDDPLKKLMNVIRGKKRFKTGDQRLNEIAECIEHSRTHKIETNSVLSTIIGNTLHKGALPMFKNMAVNFSATSACTNCGTCGRICPRNNIRCEKGSLTWGDDCELCFACSQWCSHKAIRFKDGIAEGHNPEVSAHELMMRK